MLIQYTFLGKWRRKTIFCDTAGYIKIKYRYPFNDSPILKDFNSLVLDVMYMKWFIYELRIYMKMICDLCSKFPI